MENYERIAVFLNLACDRVTKDNGKLKFITGKDTPSIRKGGRQNQETQILWFKDVIWIANNDDADTEMMRDYCDALGINTVDGLESHVDTYNTAVLPTHRGALNLRGISPKEELCVALLEAEMPSGTTRSDLTVPDPLDTSAITSVSNQTYKLSSSNAPPTKGIVFVYGNYTGDTVTSGSEHAEQKLLAALSKADTTVNGGVRITGCKSPCSVCQKVLDEVHLRLGRSLIALKYNNTAMDTIRSVAGLAKCSPSGIKDLRVDDYFRRVDG